MVNASNRLSVRRLASDQFTWTANRGCAEASDIGGFPGQRVYADARDVGFEVESGRAGAVQLLPAVTFPPTVNS